MGVALAGLFAAVLWTRAHAAGAAFGTGSPVTGFNLPEFISFVWQFYLPPLDSMVARPGPEYGYRQVFIWTQFGSYGWLEINLPSWIYASLQVALAVLALWVFGLAERRAESIARNWPVALVVIAYAVGLMLLLHIVSYSNLRGAAPGAGDPVITGRYLLPLTPLLGCALAWVTGSLAPAGPPARGRRGGGRPRPAGRQRRRHDPGTVLCVTGCAMPRPWCGSAASRSSRSRRVQDGAVADGRQAAHRSSPSLGGVISAAYPTVRPGQQACVAPAPIPKDSRGVMVLAGRGADTSPAPLRFTVSAPGYRASVTTSAAWPAGGASRSPSASQAAATGPRRPGVRPQSWATTGHPDGHRGAPLTGGRREHRGRQGRADLSLTSTTARPLSSPHCRRSSTAQRRWRRCRRRRSRGSSRCCSWRCRSRPCGRSRSPSVSPSRATVRPPPDPWPASPPKVSSPRCRAASTCPTSRDTQDILDSGDAGGIIIRGSALRLIAFGGALLASLASVPFMTRHLGEVDYGYYATVSGLLFILVGMTEAGLTNLGTREYSQQRGAGREQYLRQLVALRLVLTLAGLAIAIAFTVVTHARARSSRAR